MNLSEYLDDELSDTNEIESQSHDLEQQAR